MNRIKKVLSLLLTLVMVLSLSIGAFAEEGNAGVTMTMDKQSVAVGETVTVTLGVNKDISGIFGFGLKLHADNTVFDVVSVDTTYTINDQFANKGWIKIATYSSNGNNLTVSNNFATVVLRAKAATTNTSIYVDSIEAVKTGVADSEKVVNVTTPAAVTPIVTEKALEPQEPAFTGYAVYGGTDVSASTNDEVAVKLYVTHSDTETVTTYNAYDVTVEYDTTELEFVDYTGPTCDGESKFAHDENTGTIQFAGYGEDKEFTEAVGTLKFKVLHEGGASAIKIENAKVSDDNEAISQDAPNVKIAGGEDNTSDEILVNVAFNVKKPDFVEGDDKVAPGENYTFSFKDTDNYTYSDLVVTVGGTTFVPTLENGFYTITNVTGKIEIIVTRTANSYDVTFEEVETVTYDGLNKATYGEDYIVTVTTSKVGYRIGVVTAKIGNEIITLTSGENNTYTLAGDKITGNIVITATVVNANTHTRVIFTGDAAEDVDGGTEQDAVINKAFTFKIKDTVDTTGWTYTAMLDEVELEPNADGEYTIPAESVKAEGVTVVITKEKVAEATVEVNVYISLDEKTMYLVTATWGEEDVLAYENDTMFWSEEYNAYCWLVISETPLTVETAKSMISVVEDDAAEVTEVAYDMDVNQSTGDADINDAQLTYDMYTAKYESFDTVSMDKFLEADVNADKEVDVVDSAAVVNAILKITATVE